jgi:tetratricopeptide (TPR) repeat protein
MPMSGMRLAVLGALLVVLYSWVGYQAYVAYRRWRARRRLMAEGTLRPRMNSRAIVLAAVFVGISLLVLIDMKFGLKLQTISTGHLFLGSAAIAILYVTIKTLVVKRDRVAWRANAMVRKKQIDEAIEYLRREMTKSPKTGLQCLMLGSALAHQERWEEAAEAYRDARELSPKLLVAAVTEAEALKKLGRLDEALSRLEAVRNADPSQAAIVYAAAKVLAQMGRIDEARERLRQADEIAHAAANQQRVDAVSIANLRKGSLELIEGPSVRGFPVEKC